MSVVDDGNRILRTGEYGVEFEIWEFLPAKCVRVWNNHFLCSTDVERLESLLFWG